MRQQILLRNQSFLATEKSPSVWEKLLEARIEPFTVEIGGYVDAQGNPDPGWYQRFIVAQDFYNPRDPLLRVVRDLQHGKAVTEGALLASLQDVAAQSRYAQALATRNSGNWQRFMEDAGFYRVEDPYIRLALGARKGADPSEEASARLAASQPACIYAKAVQAAMRAAA